VFSINGGMGKSQGAGYPLFALFAFMLMGINTCQTQQRQKVDCKFSNYS